MADSQTLTEFQIIERFFAFSESAGSDVGVGDDCALLTLAAGHQLAVSIDTQVVDRHFPADAAAADIAYRSLAAATSDLAAVGARPLAATLALTLPAVDSDWLQQFSAGLHQGLEDFSMALIGGDTTRGALTISLQVHGEVPTGQALLRSGAREGDGIYVSGTLGDARAALEVLHGRSPFDAADSAYFLQRYYRPQPRLQLGQALRGLATSAIDVSDGLVADLGHIAARSGVGAQVHIDELPLSAALARQPQRQQSLQWAACGGDDYELCFTVSPSRQAELAAVAAHCGLAITRVGAVVAAGGVRMIDRHGANVDLDHAGYQHFS